MKLNKMQMEYLQRRIRNIVQKKLNAIQNSYPYKKEFKPTKKQVNLNKLFELSFQDTSKSPYDALTEEGKLAKKQHEQAETARVKAATKELEEKTKEIRLKEQLLMDKLMLDSSGIAEELAQWENSL